MIVLAEAGRSMESLPKDLAAAIQAGRIPGSVIERFLGLEKSGLMRWLMQFGGFKERLLADDLFLAKVAMECGVGIFTKVRFFFSFPFPFPFAFGFSVFSSESIDDIIGWYRFVRSFVFLNCV